MTLRRAAARKSQASPEARRRGLEIHRRKAHKYSGHGGKVT
jgi:hypothetical protein